MSGSNKCYKVYKEETCQKLKSLLDLRTDNLYPPRKILILVISLFKNAKIYHVSRYSVIALCVDTGEIVLLLEPELLFCV
jgi:hypothetical protein